MLSRFAGLLLLGGLAFPYALLELANLCLQGVALLEKGLVLRLEYEDLLVCAEGADLCAFLRGRRLVLVCRGRILCGWGGNVTSSHSFCVLRPAP